MQGPGTFNEFTTLIVIGSGPGTGTFTYNGTIAIGNLVASETSTSASFDPVGNATVGPGKAYYGQIGNAPTPFWARLDSVSGFTWFKSTAVTVPYTSVVGNELVFVPPTGTTQGFLLETTQFYFIPNQGVVNHADLITPNGHQWMLGTNIGTAAVPAESTAIMEIAGDFCWTTGGPNVIDPVALNVEESWHTINAGFPAGWTGAIHYRQLSDAASLVALDWLLNIAVTTVVTNGEAIATLPSAYFPVGLKAVSGNTTGGGLSDVYAPMKISTAGAMTYNGQGFTAAGTTATWRGSATYTLAV